jgi:hypothetical protein
MPPKFSQNIPAQLDPKRRRPGCHSPRSEKKLRGKVSFSELDNLLKEVVEQAEGHYRDWPMES